MSEALFWGLVSGSSLAIGAWFAVRFSMTDRMLGLIMAFAAGVLISAVAYELVEVAIQDYSPGGAAAGLFTGALVFFLGDWFVSRRGGEGRKSSNGPVDSSAGLPIVLGIVLDGIPESMILGLTLISGEVSLAMLAAVFLSNLPEGMAATTGLRSGGWRTRRVFGLWGVVTAVSGIAAAAGFLLFDDAGVRTIAFVLAFGAGAILTMLASTMMPEAFEDSGAWVGLATTLGFALALAIQSLE